MFTIITPLFNKTSYLRRTVDSVLSQDYGDFDWLIIDDGSTDDSYSLACKLTRHDSRVEVITKVNEGVSKARNLGLKRSKQPYIVLLDADDYWEENHLSNLLDVIELYGAKFITSKIRNVDSGWVRNFYFDSIPKALLHCSSACFSREIVDNGIFFSENYFRTEDQEFFFNISKIYRLYIAEGFTAHYDRGVAGQLTQSRHSDTLAFSWLNHLPFKKATMHERVYLSHLLIREMIHLTKEGGFGHIRYLVKKYGVYFISMSFLKAIILRIRK